MHKRIIELKSKTTGILFDEEFAQLIKHRHVTKSSGDIVERNFESFESDIDKLIDKYNKFNMKAFDLTFLHKVLDYEAEGAKVILCETDYNLIRSRYEVIFEIDGQLYRFKYRIDAFGSRYIGGLCNDMDRRLDKYICYEVDRKEIPTVRIEYHNTKKLK